MNNETMNDEERNYELARFFFNNNIPVHIVKTGGIFYNGLIIEMKVDFFFIDDKEDGKQLVFFKELVKTIQEYKEVNRE